MHAQVLHGVVALPRFRTASLGQLRNLIPLGFVGLISWSVWLLRFLLSRVYRPVPPGFTAPVSVVVPSYREDPDILDRCLSTWLAEDPDEVIVVPDLADTEVIARLRERADADPRLVVVPFAHTGKRSAVGAAARGAGPVKDPGGGRGGHPAERVPAEDQRVAAGGGLDDRRAVPGLRAGAVAGGGGGVPVGADGGLPAGGGAAGAGAPGGRVLPGPAVRGRR